MKKIYLSAIAAVLVLMTACGGKETGTTANPEKDSEPKITLETGPGPAINHETEEKQEVGSTTEAETVVEENRESEDLAAFAGNIAKEFSDLYGFETEGEYSDSEGILIVITGEGSSEWMDHAWDEMIDSINESYNTSVSTMERAGTGDTSLTYLVCDTDGVSYLRYVNGEVEDLADGTRQSVQD